MFSVQLKIWFCVHDFSHYVLDIAERQLLYISCILDVSSTSSFWHDIALLIVMTVVLDISLRVAQQNIICSSRTNSERLMRWFSNFFFNLSNMLIKWHIWLCFSCYYNESMEHVVRKSDVSRLSWVAQMVISYLRGQNIFMFLLILLLLRSSPVPNLIASIFFVS